MFWRNFRRELGRNASRLVSVIIITLVAVMLYVGFASFSYNIKEISYRYYDEQNVADYWITGQGLDKTDCAKLLQIDGVLDLQPRVTLSAESRYDGEVTVSLYAVPKEIGINIPRILEGSLPTGNNDMMLGRVFAQAQGLRVGDRYDLKLPGTGQALKMTICALVQSPEAMYSIDMKSLSPDPAHHGFAYIREGTVESLFGKNIYNQICITTAPGLDENTLKHSINEALGTKVINIVALEDNADAYNMLDISDSIKNIILIFPMLFFAVAALIMFSTMSRLIENARMTIGTYKALGYDDSKIMLYYLMYAVLVANLGFALGLLPVKVFVVFIIEKIFSSIDIPAYRVIFDGTSILVAYAITCAVCVGTAFFITRRELRDSPTACMRPKVQRAAGKNLLERLPFLWNRFGFTQKYVIRNIFRNKTRMLICIVGIASCMTLVMTALGITDTIDHYLTILSTRAQRFDVLTTLDATVTEPQYKHLERLDGVTEVQSAMTTGVKLYSADREYTTYLTVTDDTISLKLIDPYGPSTMRLPERSVILDEKIAESLGVAAGDTIHAQLFDDNEYYEMGVSAVMKSIDGVYIGRSFWRDMGKGYIPATLYLKASDASAIIRQLNDYDFVTAVLDKESVMDAARENVMSIVTIVTVLILFGGLLALIVLYNLGIVSFYEQIRSLATLMVLGFYDKEIKKLVLSENIVFTSIGVLLGAPLGVLLTDAILGTIDMMHFQTYVQPYSYLLSGALTLAFALLVNLMLGLQMRKIDMLGALKSIE
ncbi:MAG TPA: FtsX-like permease family protein [Pseudoflavonifractor sp.]|nr:FtsX-like permease family protein [Pseudoflavonifractor sp.]